MPTNYLDIPPTATAYCTIAIHIRPWPLAAPRIAPMYNIPIDKTFLPPPDDERSYKPGYQVKELRERHEQIVRMAALGMRRKDIAEATGFTPITVTNCLRSPLAQARLAQLRDSADSDTVDIIGRINGMLDEVLDLVQDVIAGEEAAPVAVRLSAGFKLLAIAGHSPVQRAQIQVSRATLGPDDIEELKKRAQDRMRVIKVVEEQPAVGWSTTGSQPLARQPQAAQAAHEVDTPPRVAGEDGDGSSRTD